MTSTEASAAERKPGLFAPGRIVEFDGLDLDQMRDAAAHWNLEEAQWGRGQFQARLRGVHTAHLQLARSRRSLGVLMRGEIPPQSMVLALETTGGAAIYWRGATVGPGEIMAPRHGDGLELGTREPSDILTIAVSEDRLDWCARAILGAPLEHWRRDGRLQLNDPTRAAGFSRLLLRSLDRGIAAARRGDRTWLEGMERGFLETLVRHVGQPAVTTSRAQRWHQAGRAEEYLRTHADQPIWLAELCETVGVNERTLYLGFRERFGLTPKAYLKILRLNLARRDLRNPGPDTTVTDVAISWCLFHLGQFSMDYRALFGESPSETLRRSLGRPDRV